jgi:5-methylcytosine-specific restriction endonuclease McrA
VVTLLGAGQHGEQPQVRMIKTQGEINSPSAIQETNHKHQYEPSNTSEPGDELLAWLNGAASTVSDFAKQKVSVELPIIETESLECCSCGGPVAENLDWLLYCSKFCQLVAELIRYHRRVLSDGRYKQYPFVREYIELKLQKLSQGVIILKNTISTDVRELVFSKTDGLCANENCLSAATELDHIAGRIAGDGLENLQGLCHACHLEKSRMSPQSMSTEMIREQRKIRDKGLLVDFLKVYATRTFSQTPQLLCDDPNEWAKIYRKLNKTRKIWRNDTESNYRAA